MTHWCRVTGNNTNLKIHSNMETGKISLTFLKMFIRSSETSTFKMKSETEFILLPETLQNQF